MSYFFDRSTCDEIQSLAHPAILPFDAYSAEIFCQGQTAQLVAAHKTLKVRGVQERGLCNASRLNAGGRNARSPQLAAQVKLEDGRCTQNSNRAFRQACALIG